MKPIIVANWKANKTIAETIAWAGEVKAESSVFANVEAVVCPPFVAVTALAQALNGTPIKVGAQNVSDQQNGAFTGEITAEMLDTLVSHAIVGHSERRRLYGETEMQVGQKIKNLLKFSITPILCISDILQMERYLEADATFKANADKIIFVYEPPSAISGGGDYHPETPVEASKNSLKISEKLGKKVPTLYGGSVSEADIAGFLEGENIAGVLVGKASLNPETFIKLAKIANRNML